MPLFDLSFFSLSPFLSLGLSIRFVLDLAADVDEHIRNVVDFVFLPRFNKRNLAALFQAQQTWTGRLKESKDAWRPIYSPSTAVIHVYQAARRVAFSVNGWQPRASDMPALATPVDMREPSLEAAFVEKRALLLFS
ncbi:hypothetical protein BJV77DRAFT_1070966 [Russula vinacea]|nr:hypothetical protein BJV77DRAFT_1070966 [Russula vinacea]